jgi:hypothetical protein
VVPSGLKPSVYGARSGPAEAGLFQGTVYETRTNHRFITV